MTLQTKDFTMVMSYSNWLTRYHTSHLGLFSLLLCEDEECISGQEAGDGYVQDGDVLSEEIY